MDKAIPKILENFGKKYRVEKIRSNIPIYYWRYIKTDQNQNPADIATRQVTSSMLLGNFLCCERPSPLKIEDSVGPEAILNGSIFAVGKETV